MTEDDFQLVRMFFHEYADSYINRNEEKAPYILKKEHTLRVCENIEVIARSLNLSPKKMALAKTAAMLHDLGRFRQYETWHTFFDPDSADHGRIGAEDIQTQGVLKGFLEEEQQTILTAVRHHNVFRLPPDMKAGDLFLTRLLRDADKVDIFRVMVGKYRQDRSLYRKEDQFITNSCKDDHRVSPELINDMYACQSLDRLKVSSLNDLKLLQISWVFDLNFRESLKIVQEKKYLDAIFESLPPEPEIEKLKPFVSGFVTGALSRPAVSG